MGRPVLIRGEFQVNLMMRKVHRQAQLLIHQVLHPRLDQAIFCDQEKTKLEHRVIFFGCAALFFGAGWTSFHIFITRVFAFVGSAGRHPSCSLISMGLGMLPLCTTLFCFYVGFEQTK